MCFEPQFTAVRPTGIITLERVSRQLVYGHFVYDTSSTDISSTDISSTVTFLADIEAGVMKRILYCRMKARNGSIKKTKRSFNEQKITN